MSIKSVMPSSHLILCHPLLLLSPIPPSIRVFSNESTLPMRWPKHWSFSFSISPSNEYPGLISFRMDWLDLLEMATNSSVLAWRIPGTGEPGGMLSMGSHRVRHDWSDLAAAAVQGTLKSLLQHHSSKASILRCSAFFSLKKKSLEDESHRGWRMREWEMPALNK